MRTLIIVHVGVHRQTVGVVANHKPGVGAAPAAKDAPPQLAANSAQLPTPDPLEAMVEQMMDATGEPWNAVLDAVRRQVEAATSLDGLQAALVAHYGALDTGELTRIMAAGFALAELKGMADVADET